MSVPGHLLGNIILFGRLLRHLGFEVTPAHIAGIAASADQGLLPVRGDFQSACRAILVRHREQMALFDLAFELFWTKYATQAAEASSLGTLLREVHRQVQSEEVVLAAAETETAGQEADAGSEREIVLTYSTQTVSHQKDFGHMDEAELEQVRQILKTFVWEFRRRTRRTRTGIRGLQVDPRKSFRYNVRYGGEPLHHVWRIPRHKPRPLVVLCDISGSMERYSRILLQFVYALSNRMDRCEAFVFSTDLGHITRQLQLHSVDDALRRTGHAVQGWGGGTRIGESIRQFNFAWARKVLGRGAVVMVISDGWDRGDIPLLEREMARLQRSCHRLIWLNPLLGSPRYEPLTLGIRAALPHVDDFRPVHNLVSLQQLGDMLADLR